MDVIPKDENIFLDAGSLAPNSAALALEGT